MLVLDHEKLDVYQVCRELSREICKIIKKTRVGRPDLTNQVLRATASVPLNIAEGNGEGTPARRASFFRIARASATEIAAGLDHMVDMELLRNESVVAAKQLVARVVAMLVKLTASVTTPDSLPPLPKRRHPRKP